MKAYPKLNLDLAIVAIDERGYHLLDSVMISLKTPFDMIAAKLGERLSLSIRGVSSLSETDNLIITAVHRICDYLNIDIPPLNFILEKRIPIGAGLGGGSSDAAAAIWITLDYLGIQIPELELLSLASKIGSDVPFCLMRQPALVGGAGQSQLEYLKKPQEQLWIVLQSTDRDKYKTSIYDL